MQLVVGTQYQPARTPKPMMVLEKGRHNRRWNYLQGTTQTANDHGPHKLLKGEKKTKLKAS